MTKPIWEWLAVDAVIHVLTMVVTFPLMAVGVYVTLFRYWSIEQSFQFVVDWIHDPGRVIP